MFFACISVVTARRWATARHATVRTPMPWPTPLLAPATEVSLTGGRVGHGQGRAQEPASWAPVLPCWNRSEEFDWRLWESPAPPRCRWGGWGHHTGAVCARWGWPCHLSCPSGAPASASPPTVLLGSPGSASCHVCCPQCPAAGGFIDIIIPLILTRPGVQGRQAEAPGRQRGSLSRNLGSKSESASWSSGPCRVETDFNWHRMSWGLAAGCPSSREGQMTGCRVLGSLLGVMGTFQAVCCDICYPAQLGTNVTASRSQARG